MIRQENLRRDQRHAFDCVLLVSWRDAQGNPKHMQVRGIDFSESGARIECSEPIDLRSSVYIRSEQFGLMETGVVRHCTSRGSSYLIGLEFSESGNRSVRMPADDFVDYYELLQISPNAEPETIHRVFRIMAARFHPDNPQTGDNETFLLLTKAYETLSDPEKRAEYNARYQVRQAEPLPIFELKEFVEGLEGEANRRLGILSLLYVRRRSNPEKPGLSLLEFETLMSFPREHLEFAVWYLREKSFLRAEYNSDYVITAEGVDYVESGTPTHRVLHRLLRSGKLDSTESWTEADAAVASAAMVAKAGATLM